MIKGVDISKHQSVVDFKKIKSAGIEFAMIRSSLGEHTPDPMFEQHMAQALIAGLDWGAYHCFFAKDIPTAIAEANFFLSRLRDKRPTYPVAVVVEDPSLLSAGKERLTDAVVAFLTQVQRAGYYVCLCADLYWLTERLDFQKLRQYDIWLPQWSSAVTFQEAPVSIWQYSGTGQVDGIVGNVNLDAAFKDYPMLIKSQYMNGFSCNDHFNVGDEVNMVGKIYRNPEGGAPYTPYFARLYVTEVLEKKEKPYRLSSKINGGTAGFACASDLRKIVSAR